MSYHFQLKTPPYIILLCRTFLTLEGIAAKVEPDFSIYTAALPFAVRRALSPETPRGKDALRAALLDDEGNFRFGYFSEVSEGCHGANRRGKGLRQQTRAWREKLPPLRCTTPSMKRPISSPRIPREELACSRIKGVPFTGGGCTSAAREGEGQ